LALTNYTQTMQQQQMDTSTQLTQYLLGASRKERREDFAELIKYVNEQRGDDQLFYARQLNKLQQDIYANPDLSGTGNINE
jgi:dTDP-D-glucose 4,6-dehydratase